MRPKSGFGAKSRPPTQQNREVQDFVILSEKMHALSDEGAFGWVIIKSWKVNV